MNNLNEITKSLLLGIACYIKTNLRYFAIIIQIMLPYVMYYIGQKLAIEREGIAFGGEVFIPAVLMIFVYYLKEVSNRNRIGSEIPIPEKRFTKIDEDGEVTIEYKRLQELILFIADLEDWMHRKGWL